MKTSRFFITSFSLLILSATFLGGCASKPKGNLVIIGGALDADNEQVFDAIFEDIPNARLFGVVPTASGVPEETGPENLELFTRWGTDRTVQLIDMPYTNPERALDEKMAAKILSQSGLHFQGGDQSRIIDVFRPTEADTPAYEAVVEVLQRGGTVSGTSAGAAMMPDPMIRWGNSREALLVGDPSLPDRGVGLRKGMGFFDFGLVDQHFIERGRLGRLIAGMELTGDTFGYGISEDRAVKVNRKNGRIETVGSQAVLFVDLSDATRDGLNRRNIRISLLGDGDTINGPDGHIRIANHKAVYESVNVDDIRMSTTNNIWDRGVMKKFLFDFALIPETVANASDESFVLTFAKDVDTQVWADPNDPRGTIGFTRMRLDIHPKVKAEQHAERLRAEFERAE